MKIDFEVQTEHGLYRDALYVDESTTDAEVEAMKQERVNNWIAVVTAPSEPEPEYIEIDGIKYVKAG